MCLSIDLWWMRVGVDRQRGGSAESAVERQEEHAEGVEGGQKDGDHAEGEQDRVGASGRGQDVIFRPEAGKQREPSQ